MANSVSWALLKISHFRRIIYVFSFARFVVLKPLGIEKVLGFMDDLKCFSQSISLLLNVSCGLFYVCQWNRAIHNLCVLIRYGMWWWQKKNNNNSSSHLTSHYHRNIVFQNLKRKNCIRFFFAENFKRMTKMFYVLDLYELS